MTEQRTVKLTFAFDAYKFIRAIRKLQALLDYNNRRMWMRFARVWRVARRPRWLSEEPRWPFPAAWEPPARLFNWARECPLELMPRRFPPIAGRGRGTVFRPPPP
jgi:hypothetical protein